MCIRAGRRAAATGRHAGGRGPAARLGRGREPAAAVRGPSFVGREVLLQVAQLLNAAADGVARVARSGAVGEPGRPLQNRKASAQGHRGLSERGARRFPGGAPQARHHVDLADIHQLGISAKSTNKKLDWQFIKFLTSSQASVKDYMLPLGGVPPLKTTEHQGNVMNLPVNRIYVNKVLTTMVGGPYNPKYGQQLQIVINALQQAALTSMPISQITKQTQSSLQRAM